MTQPKQRPKRMFRPLFSQEIRRLPSQNQCSTARPNPVHDCSDRGREIFFISHAWKAALGIRSPRLALLPCETEKEVKENGVASSSGRSAKFLSALPRKCHFSVSDAFLFLQSTGHFLRFWVRRSSPVVMECHRDGGNCGAHLGWLNDFEIRYWFVSR